MYIQYHVPINNYTCIPIYCFSADEGNWSISSTDCENKLHWWWQLLIINLMSVTYRYY